MRVVGGSLGGRRFAPPANIPARPTTDLAREGLFNILNNLLDLEGVAALDLFGGTGGVSYELISRGAAVVTVIEKDSTSVDFIKKTAKDFKIEAALNIIRGDALRFLKNNTEVFDLIFADPPYALPEMKTIPDLMIRLLQPEGIAILEHDTRHDFESHPHFIRAKKYGDTIFTFFTASRKQ